MMADLTQDKHNILISLCCMKPVLWNCQTENDTPLGICTECKEWSETIAVTHKLFTKR